MLTTLFECLAQHVGTRRVATLQNGNGRSHHVEWFLKPKNGGREAFANGGRTFFFRAWFEAPPLSSAQAVHGVVVTGWFAVFLVQALLVRHDRVALHRRLGLLGALGAVVALVSRAIKLRWLKKQEQEEKIQL